MQRAEYDLLNKLNPHCFRKPGSPLVYVATLKCASTFYSTLLLDNGWVRVYFTEIDWERDKVFGFINDPDLRYYKGLVEDVRNLDAVDHNVAESLESHILASLQNFNQHIILFSSHTVPVSIKLGRFIDKIDWIPISNEFEHHRLFLKLLQQFNLTAEPGENLDPHIADDYKKNHYDIFKNLIDKEGELYKIFTADDRNLFHLVCSKINPNGASWQEISWLKDKTPV